MKQHYRIMCVLTLLYASLLSHQKAQAQCSCPNGTAPMTQQYNQSVATSMETTIFSFPQFDPTIGTLICTNVSALISSVVRIRLENDELFPASYTIRYNRSSTISGPGLSPTLVHTFSKKYGAYDLAASDGEYFSGLDFIITEKDSILKDKLLTQNISADVTAFLGYDSVDYTYTLTGNSSISGGGNYLGGPLTSDFIDFTITYSYCEDALLASSIHNFNVSANADNTASIQWVTENEVADNRYQIEVSVDGRSYKPIALLPASKEERSHYSYSYDLDAEKAGTLYFRVRQTNSTLVSRYSSIKSISVKKVSSNQFSVHPNPATDQVRLQFGQQVSGTMQVELRNGQGMLVDNHQFVASNQSAYTFRLNHKPAAGIYFLTTVNLQTGEKFAEKIFIR
jgi:hypothetical protein